MDKVNAILQELFYKEGFTSANALYEAAKTKKVSRTIAKEFVQAQETTQIHKPGQHVYIG